MRTSDLQKLGEAYLKVVSSQKEEEEILEAKSKTEDNTNDKSDDGDGLDKVQPKAVKKKFADRKDKDIDNDGDVDDSDEFLHKRRKAVSKAMEKEGNAFTGALKAAKEKGEDEFVVAGKKYKVKEVEEDMKALQTEAYKKKVKEEEDEEEDENPVVPARDVKKKEKKKDDEEESDDEGEEEEAPEDDDEEEKPEDPKKDKGDLKKNPKTADKKAEISKIESVKTEEAFKSFWQMAEDLLEKSHQKKGATPPEEIDSKESPKSKEFIAKHGKDEKENDSLSKDNKKGEDATKPKSGKRPADSTVGEAKSLVDLAREVLAGNNPNAFAEMKGEKQKMKKESNPYDGRRKEAKSFLERMAKRRG